MNGEPTPQRHVYHPVSNYRLVFVHTFFPASRPRSCVRVLGNKNMNNPYLVV